MYKWIMPVIVTIACLFGVYLLVNQLPPKEKTAEPSSSITVADKPVDVGAAEQLYKSNCLPCHGDHLQGGIGPDLTKVGKALTKADIYKQIENGGGGMPKFGGKLSEDQLVNITNWLAGKIG